VSSVADLQTINLKLSSSVRLHIHEEAAKLGLYLDIWMVKPPSPIFLYPDDITIDIGLTKTIIRKLKSCKHDDNYNQHRCTHLKIKQLYFENVKLGNIPNCSVPWVDNLRGMYH
jgi:hypothetical protein